MESKLCGKCLKPVPVTFTAKDICRNCGNYWRSEEEIQLEAAQGKAPNNLSLFKLISLVILMGIISAFIAVGLVKFLNNQHLTESMAISSSLKVALMIMRLKIRYIRIKLKTGQILYISAI